MYQLIMVISALALEVRTAKAHALNPEQPKMIATSRAKGDPAKIAQKNGWTFCTKKRLSDKDREDILIDVIGVRLGNDRRFSISPYLAETIGEDGVAKAKQIAFEIMADAAK